MLLYVVFSCPSTSGLSSFSPRRSMRLNQAPLILQKLLVYNFPRSRYGSATSRRFSGLPLKQGPSVEGFVVTTESWITGSSAGVSCAMKTSKDRSIEGAVPRLQGQKTNDRLACFSPSLRFSDPWWETGVGARCD